MNRTVFLAHCSDDRENVRDFYHLLREDGFRPWFDEFSPDGGWEYEMNAAVTNAKTVVLFLTKNSSEKPGHLHHELMAVLECAEDLPEGTIDILAVRVPGAPIPQRVAHLPCLTLGGDDLVSDYLRFRATLAPKPLARHTKAVSLPSLSLPPEDLKAVAAGMKSAAGRPPATIAALGLFPDPSRVMEVMIPGSYVVLGQNSDGSKYYGRAEMAWRDRVFALTTTIGDEVFHYKGTIAKQALVFDGAHHVVYRRNPRNGCLFGEWDEGGLETLIPALDSSRES